MPISAVGIGICDAKFTAGAHDQANFPVGKAPALADVRNILWTRGTPTAAVQGQLDWVDIGCVRLLRVADLWARPLRSSNRCLAAQITQTASLSSSFLASATNGFLQPGVISPDAWGVGPGCASACQGPCATIQPGHVLTSVACDGIPGILCLSAAATTYARRRLQQTCSPSWQGSRPPKKIGGINAMRSRRLVLPCASTAPQASLTAWTLEIVGVTMHQPRVNACAKEALDVAATAIGSG